MALNSHNPRPLASLLQGNINSTLKVMYYWSKPSYIEWKKFCRYSVKMYHRSYLTYKELYIALTPIYLKHYKKTYHKCTALKYYLLNVLYCTIFSKKNVLYVYYIFFWKSIQGVNSKSARTLRTNNSLEKSFYSFFSFLGLNLCL